MTEPTTAEGGCLCGAVRYRIAGPVTAVTHCHCGMCRRSSGAPASTWLTLPRGALVFTREAPAQFRSSSHGERGFCPRCGSQLTFQSSRYPDEIDLTIGTLDDPNAFPAQRHSWTESRLAWLHLDEQLPSFPQESPDAAAG